jgi:hypothetical protein
MMMTNVFFLITDRRECGNILFRLASSIITKFRNDMFVSGFTSLSRVFCLKIRQIITDISIVTTTPAIVFASLTRFDRLAIFSPPNNTPPENCGNKPDSNYFFVVYFSTRLRRIQSIVLQRFIDDAQRK